MANVLKEQGIDPAPERGKRQSWSRFLKAHWGMIAASDFLTVEVWTMRGLVTHYVLFILDLATRDVHIAGITLHPQQAFMIQAARNLVDVDAGFLNGKQWDGLPLTLTYRRRGARMADVTQPFRE